MTGLAIGSALVSAYGQYQSSKAQAESLEAQAQQGFLRAEEIIQRNTIKNELLLESALVHQGTQKAQSAGSGRALESTRDLVSSTMDKAAEQIINNNRSAEWEAHMAEIGASSQLDSAGNISTAGTISAIGTLGFGAAKAYDASPGAENVNSKPKKTTQGNASWNR